MKNTELARAYGLSIELKKVNMVGLVHFWLLRPTTFRKSLWEKEWKFLPDICNSDAN